MKIYKFKDLSEEAKHQHFYQIVLNNSIWCAKPDSLNDINEFKFKLDYEPSSNTAILLSQVVNKYRTTNFLPPDISTSLFLQNKRLKEIATPIINKMINNCRNDIGIISFSSIKKDKKLWEEYGGKGNGVCIEINIPENLFNKSYYPVTYVEEKIFHVDSFLESALYQDKIINTYRNMLLTKTKRWSQEEEIRFIGKRQEVNIRIDGYIGEITFGDSVPENTFKEIKAKIINHCNENSIRITRLLKTASNSMQSDSASLCR